MTDKDLSTKDVKNGLKNYFVSKFNIVNLIIANVDPSNLNGVKKINPPIFGKSVEFLTDKESKKSDFITFGTSFSRPAIFQPPLLPYTGTPPLPNHAGVFFVNV